ncbi:hypothetical protein C7212DRAFT_364463 [Tuber magnatum]|uniref:Uncharacterized protein n=1 Tax=Tuber magnatum TaxID=42249 RepID=A0A317SLI3_9PEZI|nr:hypothetical protein C7212DRAFT_364463 [Tuber magnatum]
MASTKRGRPSKSLEEKKFAKKIVDQKRDETRKQQLQVDVNWLDISEEGGFLEHGNMSDSKLNSETEFISGNMSVAESSIKDKIYIGARILEPHIKIIPCNGGLFLPDLLLIENSIPKR